MTLFASSKWLHKLPFMMPSTTNKTNRNWVPIPQRCVSIDIPCCDLTVTDVTRLTGVICREYKYPTAMFGYLHELMRQYLINNRSKLENCTGKDILLYFQSRAPQLYQEINRRGVLTVDDAVRFRDQCRSSESLSF